MSTDQAQTKKVVRKSFSPKIKEKALRLVAEGELTQKQIATKIGCSINAIQQWKAKYQGSDESVPSVPKKTKKRGKRLPIIEKQAASAESQIACDDFVRNYWSENKRAADVLRLPPEIAPEAVRYINDVLRYAYERLHG